MTDCEMLDVSRSTTSTSSNAPSRSPPPDQRSLLSLLGLSVQKMTAALAKIPASTDLDMRARFMMGLRWEVVSVHRYMIFISVLEVYTVPGMHHHRNRCRFGHPNVHPTPRQNGGGHVPRPALFRSD